MQGYRAYRDRSKKTALQNKEREARKDEDRVVAPSLYINLKYIKRAARKIKAVGVDPAAVSPIVYNIHDVDRCRMDIRCLILNKNTNRWLMYDEVKDIISNFTELSKFKEIVLNSMFRVSKRLNYILPDMPEIVYVPPVLYMPLEKIKCTDEDKLQN